MSPELAFFQHARELLDEFLTTDAVDLLQGEIGADSLTLTFLESDASTYVSICLYPENKINGDIFRSTYGLPLAKSLEIWRADLDRAAEKAIPLNFRTRVLMAVLLAWQTPAP